MPPASLLGCAREIASQPEKAIFSSLSVHCAHGSWEARSWSSGRHGRKSLLHRAAFVDMVFSVFAITWVSIRWYVSFGPLQFYDDDSIYKAMHKRAPHARHICIFITICRYFGQWMQRTRRFHTPQACLPLRDSTGLCYRRMAKRYHANFQGQHAFMLAVMFCQSAYIIRGPSAAALRTGWVISFI